MLNKFALRLSLVVFFTLIAFGAQSYAQKTDCAAKTDNEIVMEIYTAMKVKYADQISHVNVTVNSRVVTLNGWASDKKTKKEIEKIAKKNKCVTKVNNNLGIGRSGDCAAGQKECGGICIGEKEACNICSFDPLLPGCLKQ